VPQFKVVVNDCFAAPHMGLTHVRLRETAHGKRNFTYDVNRLAAGLPRVLTTLETDFAELLGILFAIDVACVRGADEDWNRDIEAWVPVREPAHWAQLAGQLSRCFGAFTYDELTLHFVQDDDPLPVPRQGRTAHPDATSVALLSGGVDSFVGAAHLLSEDDRPLFVSHKNSGAASAALTAIMPTLVDWGAPSTAISFTARSSAMHDTENSLRARSMIYMGLACLLAHVSGIEDVWINENGVMAVHLPLTEARSGSLSTKTASPRAIKQYSNFINDALGSTVVLGNRLVDMTKPEVAKLGVGLGIGDLLAQTVSCWSIGRNGIHCGRCVPCLIRIVSHEWAGVPTNPYETTPLDVLPTGPAREVARDNVTHLLQLAVSIEDEPDDKLLRLDFPELLNVAAPQTVHSSIAMHRRWAQQCLQVASNHEFSRSFLS
jgi:7-cyano-7-deazaguanine synthase in queuosine biosynthesis